MIYQVKLPYYPGVQSFQSMTPFGVVENTMADIYTNPLRNKYIAQVDTLRCLQQELGVNCMVVRKYLYEMLSGRPGYEKIFEGLYRSFKDVMAYANDMYYYGDPTVPIVQRCIVPLRKKVDEYRAECGSKFSAAGGKFLMTTHDYIYYAFNQQGVIPDVIGGKVIC